MGRSLRHIFNRLLGRRPDPTEDWPLLSLATPEIASSRRSIGPLRFGDELPAARALGRPTRFQWTRPAYAELVYADAGFGIDFDAGRLAYAAFYIGPDEFLPAGIDIKFSAPRLDGRLHLTRELTPPQVEAVCGTPKAKDIDDNAIILFYEMNALTLEFEFAPRGPLKRCNVYPIAPPA